MFNMQERMDLVKLLKQMTNKSGVKLPQFKDVKPPSVNYKEDFATVALVDTDIVIALTTTSKKVTFTNTSTRKIESTDVDQDLREKIIEQMLKFDNCIRYS